MNAEFSIFNDSELKTLYSDLVEWIHKHPEDEDAKKRLDRMEDELEKRGII